MKTGTHDSITETSRELGVRHQIADRFFHWVMATTILVLAATAFLPILGLKFDWLPIHWITGVVLTVSILFHLYRVFAVHGIRSMTPGLDDVREAARSVVARPPDGLESAKYDAFQKAYHWATSLTVLVVVITGLIMLPKIDTTFWSRDPSILTDPTWGLIYVFHGAGALLILFLVILHIYFGLLPDHREYLRAMLRGPGPEFARKSTK